MKPHRNHNVAIFLSIIVVFLLFANWAVYASLVSMFALSSSLATWLLIAILFLMSAGFISASVLGSYFYNWFTRAFYTITAVWMGFFIYLLMSSIVYGILLVVFLDVGFPSIDAHILGIVLVGVSVLITIYGLFQATRIQVKEITVALPNLPAAWQGRTAVWVSDVHLGQILGPSFARRVVDKVNALSPDIVFIGGDLYDGTSAPDANVLIAPFAHFSAPLGTYFITGNHEEFGDSSKVQHFLEAVLAIGMRTLVDAQVDVEGVQIIGVDYRGNTKKEAFRNTLSSLRIPAGKPSILLKHEPKDIDVASEAGISLQISGHTHRAQQWPLEYIARWLYKDFAYGLQKYGAMSVYTSSGVGTWGPPVRVGTDAEMVVIKFH